MIEIRTCPICSSNDGVIEVSPDEAPTLQNVPRYWSGFLNKKIFFDYKRCGCGVLYCDNYPSDKFLSKLYSDMGNNEHSNDAGLELSTQADYAEQIAKNFDGKKLECVLELGPDNGRLVRELNKRLDIETYVCVEPNQNVHEELKSNHNIVVLSSLEQLKDTEFKFNAIIGIHVADHIPNVLDIMRPLVERSVENAKLFLVVHNEKSILSKLLGKRWPPFCLQHPQLFNPKTGDIFLRRLGFKQVSCIPTANHFNLGYLLQHALLATLRLDIKLPKLMRLKLRLGNIMFIGVK